MATDLLQDPDRNQPGNLLEIRDLTIALPVARGRLVRIVENVSFSIAPREILGIVGESGSGKSMTALAIMGLIDSKGAEITGSIRYKGRELIGLPPREFRRLRGREIAMIFQDPMTALTPVHTIGWQIDEQIRAHERLSHAGARARTVQLLGARACRIRSAPPSAIRTSFPVACASAP